jgi:hypothetical protein
VTAAKETWLTAYGDAYRERWGQESEPPWGEMALHLKATEATVGRVESIERWRRFLAAAERPEFSRPHLFKQGLGQWSERYELAPAEPVHNGGRKTAAQTTTDTVRMIAAREQAKKGGAG